MQRGSCGGEAKSFSANQRSTDAATELSEKLGVTSEGRTHHDQRNECFSPRPVAFGGLAAITAAGAGALAGCAPQQKMASTGAAAAEDGSTYVGPSFLQKPAEITEFDEEHTYDVVVVGAGESGLSAMHAALEAGATVGALQSLLHRADRRQHGRFHRFDEDERGRHQGGAVLHQLQERLPRQPGPGRDLGPQLPGGAGLVGRGCAKGGSESKPYDYTVNCNGHEVFFHANTYFHDEGHQKGALRHRRRRAAEAPRSSFRDPCVQLLVEDGRVAGAIGETKDGAHAAACQQGRHHGCRRLCGRFRDAVLLHP